MSRTKSWYKGLSGDWKYEFDIRKERADALIRECFQHLPLSDPRPITIPIDGFPERKMPNVNDELIEEREKSPVKENRSLEPLAKESDSDDDPPRRKISREIVSQFYNVFLLCIVVMCFQSSTKKK